MELALAGTQGVCLPLWTQDSGTVEIRRCACADQGGPVPGQPERVGNGALAPSSLVELAVQRLCNEILSGALVPGERLIEEQLTRRFGTSRAPLREALRLLGQQGLVEHLPRRGVRVAELSPQDVDELFGLREVLERFSVQIAPPVPEPLTLRSWLTGSRRCGTRPPPEPPWSRPRRTGSPCRAGGHGGRPRRSLVPHLTRRSPLL